MRRTVKAAARCVQEVALAGSGRTRPWLLTLTYANPDSWEPRHISELLNCLRKWAARRGFDIPNVWVAEIQPGRLRTTGKAVVHYHVVVWVPHRFALPNPDKQGWWRHGFTNRVRARKPIGYLLKYASKGDAQVRFPRGLRLCGHGGLTARGRELRYWMCLPNFVLRAARTFQRVTRMPGGLWLLEDTGEVLRSAWEFVRFDPMTRAAVLRPRRSKDEEVRI